MDAGVAVGGGNDTPLSMLAFSRGLGQRRTSWNSDYGSKMRQRLPKFKGSCGYRSTMGGWALAGSWASAFSFLIRGEAADD